MGSDSVTVREATLLDAEGIGLIHRLGLHSAFSADTAAAARAVSAHRRALEWREWLRARSLGRAPSVVLVAETMHGLVGLWCAVAGYPPGPAKDWRLVHFYVLPTHQGQGLAARMLAAALPRLADAGARRLSAWRPQGSSSATLFEDAGAAPPKEGRVFIDHEEVAVRIYTLNLDHVAGDRVEGPRVPA